MLYVMISNIKELASMNWLECFILIILAMLVYKGLVELKDWFFKRYGIETKKMKEERESREKILANAEAIKELAEIHKRDNDISNEHDDKLRDEMTQFMTEVRSDIGELKSSLQETFNNRANDRQVSLEREQRLNSRIDSLVDASKQRDVSVNDISNALNKLTTMFIDKEISDYRWEIINFATAISEKKPCSKEAFRHCFATYEKYEKILEKNGLENGEVTASMEIITETYKKKLLEGF